MSRKYLGEKFDIHGGGMDLKFPHHECEIAQGIACSGHAPVNYWMHANLLTLNGKKMSKSSGNNILPGEILNGDNPLLTKAYSAPVVRFLMMQTHYRSVMDFSNAAILSAEKGYNRLIKSIESLSKLEGGEESTFDIYAWKNRCYDAMNDDFNTPILISQLFEGVNLVNQIKEKSASLVASDLALLTEVMSAFVDDVLGLGVMSVNNGSYEERLDGTIKLLIELRDSARANKNYLLSDQIRERLTLLNISLEDGKGGTEFRY